LDFYNILAFFGVRRVFFRLGARVILPVALYGAMALLIISRSFSVNGTGSTTKTTPFGSFMYPMIQFTKNVPNYLNKAGLYPKFFARK
jgi:hypothetical protein